MTISITQEPIFYKTGTCSFTVIDATEDPRGKIHALCKGCDDFKVHHVVGGWYICEVCDRRYIEASAVPGYRLRIPWLSNFFLKEAS